MSTDAGLPQDCNEMIRQIVAYWRSQQDGGRLPDRRQIDPVCIPRHLTGITLIDATFEPARFRFIGSDLVDHHGANYTGRWLDEVFPHFEGTQTQVDMVDVLRTGAPVYRKGKPLMTYEKAFVEIERVMLPYRNGGDRAELVLIYSMLN